MQLANADQRYGLFDYTIAFHDHYMTAKDELIAEADEIDLGME